MGGTLRCRLRLPVLWHRALAAIHGWVGHLARGKESDLGAAAVRWRNAEWWEVMMSARANSPDLSWRHPKKNWVRGFEGALVRICGTGWRDFASGSRENWLNQR